MPSPAFHISSSFQWKMGLAVALVGIGDWLFFQQQLHGGYFGLYALALLAGLFAGSHAVRRDRRAWIAAAAAMLFAFALLYDTSFLAWCLFWTSATMAALIPSTAAFGDGWQWFQRLVWQGLRGPFAPLIDLRRMSKARRRRGRGRFGLRAMLPVLALPVVGSSVILLLFTSANPVLARSLSSLAMPELSLLTWVRISLWVALLVLAWGLLRSRLARCTIPTFDGHGDLPLPGVSVVSVLLSLVAFNLLFALQNLLDIAYFWGLAEMPPDMTMAQYAHRGAYPLIATALLAAAFVLVTLRPGSATAKVPAVRRLVVLWIAQNLLLVAFSMQRTLEYVEAYSLTKLRIAALAWMVLVAFGLTAICWRLLRDRSAGWLINVNIAAAGLLLALASFADLGATAASWNVRHAREVGGRGVELDLCYLDRLGHSALLSLVALEQRSDLKPEFRERVQAVLERRLARLERDMENGWTLRGQRRLEQGRSALARRSPEPLAPGLRRCDGALVPSPDLQIPNPPAEAAAPAPAAASEARSLPPGTPSAAR